MGTKKKKGPMAIKRDREFCYYLDFSSLGKIIRGEKYHGGKKWKFHKMQ